MDLKFALLFPFLLVVMAFWGLFSLDLDLLRVLILLLIFLFAVLTCWGLALL